MESKVRDIVTQKNASRKYLVEDCFCHISTSVTVKIKENLIRHLYGQLYVLYEIKYWVAENHFHENKGVLNADVEMDISLEKKGLS